METIHRESVLPIDTVVERAVPFHVERVLHNKVYTRVSDCLFFPVNFASVPIFL